MTANVINTQSGDRRSTNIVKETSTGVAPTTAWYTLRNSGGAGIQSDYQSQESTELTGTTSLGDRDIIRTGKKVNVDYNGLMYQETTAGTDPLEFVIESILQAEFGDVTANRLTPGNKEVTLTFEDIFNDVVTTHAAQGVQITNLTIDISADGPVTYSFSGVGPTYVPNSPTVVTVNATASASASTITINHGNASGATTDATGYAVGVSTVTLASAGTGDIKVGDNLAFAGDSNTYIATSAETDVSDGGTVSFTPPLKVAIPASATAITVTEQTIPAMDTGYKVIVRDCTTTANHGTYDLIDATVASEQVEVDGTLTDATETMTIEYIKGSVQSTTPTAAGDNRPFYAGDAVGVELTTDGSTWFDSLDYGFRFSGAQINISLAVEESKEITQTDAWAINPNKRSISVTMNYAFITRKMAYLLEDQTEFGIRFLMIDDAGTTAATGNKKTITMPRVQVTADSAGDASKGASMVGNSTLMALQDLTTGIDIQIDRVAAT